MTTVEQALQNAVLALPVGVKNHPGVLVYVEGGSLFASATDGYVYINTMVLQVDMTLNFRTFVPKAALKAAIDSDEETALALSNLPVVDDPEMEAQLQTLRDMASDDSYDSAIPEFRYAPDRLKKLGSLKPEGRPVTIRLASENGLNYARFGYGGSTVGVFTLLEEDEDSV